MLKPIFMSIIMGACATSVAAGVTVKSPDGKLAVSTEVNDGHPCYTITFNGKEVIGKSPLGFRSNVADFSSMMSIADTLRGSIDKHYTQDKIKHSDIAYKANTLAVTLQNRQGNEMTVEWQVSDNNVALRYAIPRQGDTGAMIVHEEMTGYRLPENSTVFMTSQSDPMIGWKRTKPSYEEIYHIDAPLGTSSDYGHGFTSSTHPKACGCYSQRLMSTDITVEATSAIFMTESTQSLTRWKEKTTATARRHPASACQPPHHGEQSLSPTILLR